MNDLLNGKIEEVQPKVKQKLLFPNKDMDQQE